MKMKQPRYQINADLSESGGGLNSISAVSSIDNTAAPLIEGAERITAHATNTPIDTTLAEPLEKIFDLKQIQTGFDIATTLGQNLSEFYTIQTKDRDTVGQKPATGPNGEVLYERNQDGSVKIDKDTGQPIPITTVAQAYANGYQAYELNEASGALLTEFTDQTKIWGNGGWGTIVLTSLAGAVSGNVTGGAAQLIQNSAINVIQQYAAQGNKAIADAVNNPALSEVVRGLLHSITSCVATDTKGGSCAEGATAAASTVALNNLFNVEVKNMTEAEKLAYSNLIQSIVSGVAFGAGGNAANAQFNAQVEVDNNLLYADEVRGLFNKTVTQNEANEIYNVRKKNLGKCATVDECRTERKKINEIIQSLQNEIDRLDRVHGCVGEARVYCTMLSQYLRSARFALDDNLQQFAWMTPFSHWTREEHEMMMVQSARGRPYFTPQFARGTYQVISYARTVSTAKPGQSVIPRTQSENIAWNNVLLNPKADGSRAVINMNYNSQTGGGDPRFPVNAGFQKMEYVYRTSAGNVTIHYQYNSITNQAYDMKIVTKPVQ